jgi:isoleucyl-tRNA synthetase
MGKGTGLVHTAPAHGMEDYSVASHFKLSVVRSFTNISMGLTEQYQLVNFKNILASRLKAIMNFQ